MHKISLILKILLIITVTITCSSSVSKVETAVKSPNEKAVFYLSTDKQNGLNYSVWFNGKKLIQESPIVLEFINMPPLHKNLIIKNITNNSVNETWTPSFSKSSTATNHFNEQIITLKETSGTKRVFNIEVRAYDDGVAFRYYFPEQNSFNEIVLQNEKTTFQMNEDFVSWAANYKTFKSHQEAKFLKRKISEIDTDELIGLPLLSQCDENTWMAITESNLRNWAGMYLKRDPGNNLSMVSTLSPDLKHPEIAVSSKTPVHSPWRTIMLGETPGELIESNLILSLSDKTEIADESWIKPGISAWDQWWPGAYAPDADFEVGMNTKTIKYYTDFAQEMGLEYILLDFMWYGNPYIDSVSWKPSPTADITKSSPDVDMPEVLKYTAERGIKIILWLHWVHAEKQMDEAFKLYQEWGIAGLKIDMMTRDDQEMVNWYEKVLKKAAEHELTVVFHGCYKPTGLRRTFPNLLTREGVLGNEFSKTTTRITPEHNVTIPFTRMLAGPIDFTPGGFRHKHQKDFEVQPGPGRWQKTPPYVMGTRCHQLAMFVVYESPLQILCDAPYNYSEQQGTDFIKLVPTYWDETKVLEGYPGEYIVIARRKNNTWYIAGMTNMEKRNLNINLGFLNQANILAQVQIWDDHELSDRYPEKLDNKTKLIDITNSLNIEMASEGGFVAILKPFKK